MNSPGKITPSQYSQPCLQSSHLSGQAFLCQPVALFICVLKDQE